MLFIFIEQSHGRNYLIMPFNIQSVNTDAFFDVTDIPEASHKFDRQSIAYSFTISLFADWPVARFGKLAPSIKYSTNSFILVISNDEPAIMPVVHANLATFIFASNTEVIIVYIFY
nr:MAG TPA: hypothetical protein [Caudoviricetes sp.]